MISLKNRNEIGKMRRAGRLVGRVLKMLENIIEPGISTGRLNALAEEECRRNGALPVFRNYPHPRGGRAFPAAICTSLNEEVVHGIPGSRLLKEGDIISIDFGVILDGFAGDAAITVPVGQVDSRVRKLITTTEESLMRGIEQAQAGRRLGGVSQAIQEHAEKNCFSVVRDFVGHGIGRDMHEQPPVPNYGKRDRGPVLKEGMTIAIEPMLNIGSYQVYTRSDEWTVVTRDGSWSAHFEHSIAITAGEPEILTLR
ncbi:MAG: type I methionyl aminopeptidase [Syntrophomonas sp.]|uniref:type I methionyl aminopeptidase n=1 Tax=Syntrophomonas sp. TaxID=2053627 RepID=UPI00262709E4|nr:type I methionyl aminopeptidase [Syntrophomonas sp.]MDD2509614.1 type I methionyl aminopeptidase [Syntrophomonas sp.]MDD4626261.1 type I methionyl aminopeptidase [Syntrophomonas sp.]